MNSQPTRTPTMATGLPMVGFGTYLITDEDAPGAVAAAIGAGYRHIDTAAGYHNEAGVGEGIRLGLSTARPTTTSRTRSSSCSSWRCRARPCGPLRNHEAMARKPCLGRRAEGLWRNDRGL